MPWAAPLQDGSLTVGKAALSCLKACKGADTFHTRLTGCDLSIATMTQEGIVYKWLKGLMPASVSISQWGTFPVRVFSCRQSQVINFTQSAFSHGSRWRLQISGRGSAGSAPKPQSEAWRPEPAVRQVKDATHHAAAPCLLTLSFSNKPRAPRNESSSSSRSWQPTCFESRSGKVRATNMERGGQKTKRILLFNYFIKIPDAIKCPRYIHPIVPN